LGQALPLAAVLSLLPLSVEAEEAHGTALVIFENDLFYNTDRDYTNGTEFTWTPSGIGQENLPAPVADLVPGFLDPEQIRASYSLGQLMFTPEQTELFTPPPTERPYAGFLYGALALTDEANQLRLQVGMVGPASLAADAQKFVHAVRGLELPQGWHAQLRDEPGLVATYERTQDIGRIAGKEGQALDVKTHFGGAAGNVFDYANIGAMARLGFNLPDDDGPPRIGPAPPDSYAYEPTAQLGAYLFAGLEGRLVARNLFLDGNSFRTGPHVAKEPDVTDISLGGAIAFQNFRLSFTHVFRSREFRTQQDPDQFGSLSLSANF
jgi:hypothetical protein